MHSLSNHRNIEWLSWPEVKKLIALFRTNNIEIRFDGGAVRDALAGRSPNDIDVVTPALLPDILSLCEKACYSVTVLSHKAGLVKVEIGNREFDITSLPQTLETKHIPTLGLSFDGLCAAYATILDFSINSLFADTDGTIFDFQNGLEDLRNGKIIPIGDVQKSFRNDPRRILRFFRFQTIFGKGEPDPKILALIQENVGCLKQAVNTQSEMHHILSADHPYPMLKKLVEYDIIRHVFGFKIISCEAIQTLGYIEKMIGKIAQPSVRLLLLLNEAEIPPKKALREIFKRWEFSDKNQQILRGLQTGVLEMSAEVTPETQARLRKELGDVFNSLVILSWAMEADVYAVSEAYGKLLGNSS